MQTIIKRPVGACSVKIKLLKEATAVQNEVALSYHRVRGLYFLAVVFATTMTLSCYLDLLYLIQMHIALFSAPFFFKLIESNQETIFFSSYQNVSIHQPYYKLLLLIFAASKRAGDTK